ncbi:hypothetical protein [Fulvivirga sedimenti]|nr:hypothetical protein [Fulvivirga sedimenti]
MGKRKGLNSPFPLSDVAKELDPVNWEELMEPVNLVAEVLIMQGYIKKEGDFIALMVGKEKYP